MASNGSPQAAPQQLPEKEFFKIGEVAALAQVEAYVLRYWEREFPFLQPEKSASGQRLYRREDVETVLRIKTLLYEQGFTIAGARKQLESLQGNGSPQAGEARPASEEGQAGPAAGQARTRMPASATGGETAGAPEAGTPEAAVAPDLGQTAAAGDGLRSSADREKLRAIRRELADLLTRLSRG